MNTQQLRRQNFCSSWTSLVELSITYGLFRQQLNEESRFLLSMNIEQ